MRPTFMVKLFLRTTPTAEGFFQLDRDQKKRLTKVMRLKTGDGLQVFTPGKRWECELFRITPEGAELRVIRELSISPTSRLHLSIGQAMPKGDRFEWLIQKATEMGVTEIFPLITERTIVHPSNPDAKLQRWNEIADHAGGQSENAFPTTVHPPLTLLQFLALPHEGLRLLLHEREESAPLREVLSNYHGDRITYVVGPEGGWSTEETNQLEKAGFVKVHLGSRVLRSETAGLVMAAVLEYQFGDF